MRIESGKTRVVVVTRKWAVKIPKVYLFTALRMTRGLFKSGDWWRDLFTDKYDDTLMSIRGRLFFGIKTNWREYRFYRRTRLRFLVPTYFSLFGLLNIQRAGVPHGMHQYDLWYQLVRMTNREAMVDLHTLSNPDNYCATDGHLQIMDYGNPKIHDFLEKHGGRIYEKFDISYDEQSRKR